MLCPPGIQRVRTHAVGRTHPYHGLAPLRSLVRAIATARPDLLLPGDDLAAGICTNCIAGESRIRGSGGIGSLIERSLGRLSPIRRASRAAFMELARKKGSESQKGDRRGRRGHQRLGSNGVGLPAVLKADGTSGRRGACGWRARSCRSAACFSQVKAPLFLARALNELCSTKTTLWLRPRYCGGVRPSALQGFVEGGTKAHQHHRLLEGTVLAGLPLKCSARAMPPGTRRLCA